MLVIFLPRENIILFFYVSIYKQPFIFLYTVLYFAHNKKLYLCLLSIIICITNVPYWTFQLYFNRFSIIHGKTPAIPNIWYNEILELFNFYILVKSHVVRITYISNIFIINNIPITFWLFKSFLRLSIVLRILDFIM